ncbi:MAG: NHL repeat-containing protein [Rubricoccaceae bacterium]|nr:NHL repeat-containing protein [Rubricoccaceae bacterium]
MIRFIPLLLVVLGAYAAACASATQQVESVSERVEGLPQAIVEVAEFRDARAVASDPAGNLYVVDAADSKVVMLSGDGQVRSTFGGVGSGDYSLLEPSDVDPTNGLEIFVADTGNSRIQRLSYDGQLIETIHVPLGDPVSLRAERPRDGRPIAVSIGPAQTMYAVEEERGVVLKWEASRRLTSILGRDGTDAALVRPVGIAISSSGRVLVADAGQNAVFAYGELGEFLRTIPALPDDQLVSVSIATVGDAERVLAVHEQSISIHDLAGGLVDVITPSLDAPLVDVAIADGKLLLLTSTRLLRVE